MRAKPPPNVPASPALTPALRARAEALARNTLNQVVSRDASLSPDKAQELLFELRVHQIELEMQNEELRQAQRSLDAERERYFDLYDLAPVSYFTVSEKGLIVQANLTAATLLGISRSALLKQAFIQFLHQDDRGIFHDCVKRLEAGSDVQACDLRLLRKAAPMPWVHLTASAATDSVQARTLRVVLTDISERKQAERYQRIAAIAFESQQGMFITDANQVILRVNSAFSSITGYSADEALGQTPRLLKSGRHDALFYTAMWSSINASGAWHGEIWNRRKNGSIYPQRLDVSSVRDGVGRVTHYVGALTDLTEAKATEEEVKSLAFTDLLTGLPNRRALIIRLQNAISAAVRQQELSALLFLDLDQFKSLNGAIGHEQADLVLQQVAERLKSCGREHDTVARIGGDEFVLLIEHLSSDPVESRAQAETLARKVQEALRQPYQIGERQLHCSASIGLSFLDSAYEQTEEPLKRAELAMYQAKAGGRDTLRFFEPQMQEMVSAKVTLEADLRQAIADQQFRLYYQAQVSDEQGIIGVEVLLRWHHPERGLVSPAEFIPLAEETGLILPIGAWVLQGACEQLALWAGQPKLEHLSLAVNVSARQFRERDFVEQVLSTLERTLANPQRLKLQLTESILLADVADVIAKMRALKAKGVGFEIDDFGTGYSSLAYLKRLPLDRLKIDQGFVRDILMGPDHVAIARAIIVLADSLGLGVIAEGVETQAQRELLASLGCHTCQGYLFSKPLPVDEFEALVRRACGLEN